jgi:heme exporter protein B
MTKLLSIIGRDVRVALRTGGAAFETMTFAALVIVLFAFALGPDRQQLSQTAAPVLWTTALLASMSSFDRIFQSDYEDGSLDGLIEGVESVGLVALAKAAGHWLSALAPLILATPFFALLLGVEADAIYPLLASLLIGTPALSLLGVVAAALTLSLRRAVILMTLLAAPLAVPVLIFGVGAAEAGAAGDPAFGPTLMLLAAFSIACCVLAPLAAAAAIRFNAG